MYCSSCGTELSKDASYCYSCGGQTNIPPIEAGNAEAAVPITSHEDLSTTLYEHELKLFVRDNVKYYSGKWKQHLAPDKRAGWNWAAFFLGLLWVAYRKMYTEFFGILMIIIILNLIVDALSRNYLSSMEAYVVLSGFYTLSILVISIGFGINGNTMYYNHCHDHIDKVRKKFTNAEERSQVLMQKGGTSFTAAILCSVASVVISLVTIFGIFLITALINHA